jgi:hypothetical protein
MLGSNNFGIQTNLTPFIDEDHNLFFSPETLKKVQNGRGFANTQKSGNNVKRHTVLTQAFG